MSQFKTNLKSEQVGKWEYILLDDLVLEDDELGTITVPKGFETDYASIRSLHNVFLFVLYALVAGYGNASAAVHDFLYRSGTLDHVDRKSCDKVFYRALRGEGIAKWRAWLFYAGVRLGGASSYKAK